MKKRRLSLKSPARVIKGSNINNYGSRSCVALTSPLRVKKESSFNKSGSRVGVAIKSPLCGKKEIRNKNFGSKSGNGFKTPVRPKLHTNSNELGVNYGVYCPTAERRKRKLTPQKCEILSEGSGFMTPPPRPKRACTLLTLTSDSVSDVRSAKFAYKGKEKILASPAIPKETTRKVVNVAKNVNPVTHEDNAEHKGAYRSSLSAIHRLFNTLELRSEHINVLKATPFWAFCDVFLSNKIKSVDCRNFNETVIDIIKTYQVAKRNFLIGNNEIEFRGSDIKMLFGISCGNVKLNLSYARKSDTPFISRRFKDTTRLSAPEIRQLLGNAVRGKSDEDVEDVVRLLCLYLCVKVFFPTSGQTLGWVYLHHIEDLRKMRTYDWTDAIRQTLMKSISIYYETPLKVTGCAVALPFWLCEHTRLLDPINTNSVPRLLKWNLAQLHTAMKKKPLSELQEFEVFNNELRMTNEEKYILASWKEMEYGGHKSGSNRYSQPVIKGVHASEPANNSVTVIQCNSRQPRKVRKLYIDIESSSSKQKKCCSCVTKLQDVLDDKEKAEKKMEEIDFERAKLQRENERMRLLIVENERRYEENQTELANKAEMDVGKLRMSLEEKEIELVRLRKIVVELEADKGQLQNELEEHEVHVITQRETRSKGKAIVNEHHILNKGWIQQNSLVRNIKNKTRRANQMPEYEYGKTRGKKASSSSVVPMDVNVQREGNERDANFEKAIVNVDNFVEAAPKRSKKMDLTNRLPIYKLVSAADKELIALFHMAMGDRGILWTGTLTNNNVSFEDISSLVKGKMFGGNVIDAYCEILTSQQMVVEARHDSVLGAMSYVTEFGKSYFVSSLCMTLVAGLKSGERNPFLDRQLNEAGAYKYVHFPLYHANHWTLLVYHTEDNDWLHYNSYPPRPGIKDKHLIQAALMKQYVEELHIPHEEQNDSQAAQNRYGSLGSVIDSPHQKPGSLDCGPIICHLMKQHAHHEFIDTYMNEAECKSIRASLVHEFINDPIRSWRPKTNSSTHIGG